MCVYQDVEVNSEAVIGRAGEEAESKRWDYVVSEIVLIRSMRKIEI